MMDRKLLLIHSSRYLKKEYWDVVDKTIQINGFFGHPENILLSMLTDEKVDVREMALGKIKDARLSKNESLVWNFNIPKLNFNATNFIKMLDWNKWSISEPPLIANISNEGLDELVATNNLKEMLNLPCHTERCVKVSFHFFF